MRYWYRVTGLVRSWRLLSDYINIRVQSKGQSIIETVAKQGQSLMQVVDGEH